MAFLKTIKKQEVEVVDTTKKFKALTVEPSTVALWNFDEVQKPFVDEVNSLQLDTDGTSNIPNFFSYEVDKDQILGNGKMKNIAPGFTTMQNRLELYGANGTLAPAGSFTFEAYFRNALDQNIFYVFYGHNTSNAPASFFYFTRAGAMWGRIYASDGTFVTANTAEIYNFNKMDAMHAGIQYDAENETFNLLFNGETVGTTSAASLTGKTFELDDVALFGIPNSAVRYGPFTMYQARISHAAVCGCGVEV